MRRSFVLRIRLISVLCVVGVLILLGRLYYIQVLQGAAYRTDAESQYVATGAVHDDRYGIFFTGKGGEQFAAALMESGYRIAIRPQSLLNPEAVYEALNHITPVERERFRKSAAKKDDPYEEVAFHVGQDAAASIRDARIDGVSLVAEKWRTYPWKERAAQVLGFVGWKDNVRVGRYGLERYYEDVLRKDSDGLYVNFFAQIFSNIGALSGLSGRSGDVITSIEPTVEQRLEEVLRHVADTYHPRLSGGIIIDPRDGSIKALAAYPTFDPNTFNTISDPSVFANPLVESVFEFGSIMKPLTMTAGIDEGVITPETTYDDTGCIVRDGAKVCNYDGKARGRVSMQEVLNQSLNTGAAFVAEKLGHERFSHALLGLGLDEETGIDLPGEVPGITAALKSGSALDLASASFGQGIATTPIAMTRALGALANHGVLTTPHVANRIRLSTGAPYAIAHSDERRVFKAESADAVTTMLITVVDNALVQGKISMPHHTIAAKTGTAQIAKPGGGYYTDRYLHSFFGYFPAHDPQFLIFLFTVEPKGVSYASQTLAEPFGDLAKFLVSYYDIPPDR